MAGAGAPLSWDSSVVQLDPTSGKPMPGYPIDKNFGIWLDTSVLGPIASAPNVYPAVNLPGTQNAAIGTTPIPLPSLATGAFRITWYLEKTVADGVSSSAQVIVGPALGAFVALTVLLTALLSFQPRNLWHMAFSTPETPNT